VLLGDNHDYAATAADAAALAEEGLHLAIVYLRSPLTPAVLEPLAEALMPLTGGQ
jgi:hypothetical protein